MYYVNYISSTVPVWPICGASGGPSLCPSVSQCMLQCGPVYVIVYIQVYVQVYVPVWPKCVPVWSYICPSVAQE